MVSFTSQRMVALLSYRFPNEYLLIKKTFKFKKNGFKFGFYQRDLEYWSIDELIMEPCCALKYFPKIEVDYPFLI